jgi:hypothetical protein
MVCGYFHCSSTGYYKRRFRFFYKHRLPIRTRNTRIPEQQEKSFKPGHTLTGFLFNSVRGTDTICAGQVPNMLTASQPKGGDGTYVYTWEQSTDSVSWTVATGTNTLRTLQPPALTQTTLYRRVVTSNFIFDTSRVIQVYVYPAINSNSITGTDTICFNKQAKNITGTLPTGGNGTYQYLWQYSTDQAAWNSDGTTNPHDPGILQQSRYYRRIVTSAIYCSHTSNTVRITVLPSITNNAFATLDTVICENQRRVSWTP